MSFSQLQFWIIFKRSTHQVVAQDLKITPSRVSPDVSVSRGVLDRSVVSFFRVRFEFEMASGSLVFGGQTEVDQIDLILVGLAVAQQQVLSLDVVVNVTL